MAKPLIETGIVFNSGELNNVELNNEGNLELYNKFNCLLFNTSNNVTIPTFTIPADQTIEQWGYSLYRDNSMLFSLNSYTNGADLYFLETTYNTICWNTGDGQTNPFKLDGVNILIPSANEWHHYAVVCDSQLNKTLLYIDGVYQGEQVYKTPQQTSKSVIVGNYISSTSYAWKGKIMDFRIWNYARTQQEILDNYLIRLTGSESGLIGYWKLDEGTGTTITDLTGNNKTGNISGTIWYDNNDEILENEYYPLFNGGSSYVYLGNPQVLQPNNITVEQWFKQPESNTTRLLIRKRLYGYNIVLNTAGILGCSVSQNSSQSVGASTTNRMDDNQWHHVQFTYNGSTIRLYVDGEFYTSNTGITSNQIYYQSGGIAIGRDGDSSGSYFKGFIQDVRIWNIVRTDQEILDNYNTQLIGNESGLVGYWKLDEGSGTVAIDTTGTTNGTINSIYWIESSMPYSIDLNGYRISPEYEFNDITSVVNSIIEWNQITPVDTQLEVSSNVQLDGVNWQGWKECINESQIPDLSIGTDLSTAKIKFKYDMLTDNQSLTPELQDIRIVISDIGIPNIEYIYVPERVTENTTIAQYAKITSDVYEVTQYYEEEEMPVIESNNQYFISLDIPKLTQLEEEFTIRYEQIDLENNLVSEESTFVAYIPETATHQTKNIFYIDPNYDDYPSNIYSAKSIFSIVPSQIEEHFSELDASAVFSIIDETPLKVTDYYKRMYEILVMSKI